MTNQQKIDQLKAELAIHRQNLKDTRYPEEKQIIQITIDRISKMILNLKAENAMKRLIRIHLSNRLNTTPAAITNEQIDELYTAGEDDTYTFQMTPIRSIENGKTVHSISLAFVNKESGLHFNNTIINN